MITEKKHKINVWCPGSLWGQVEALGFDSPTKAVIAAFENLVSNSDDGSCNEQIRNEENAKIQEMEKRLEETQKQIEELKKDKQDLIEMYDKHVLQVQTLINQKTIEASEIKKPYWRLW